MHIAATLPAMRVCHCFSSSSVAFADFDQSVQQINSFDQGSTRGVHTVREGETLQSIAAALWRDASATAVAFSA